MPKKKSINTRALNAYFKQKGFEIESVSLEDVKEEQDILLSWCKQFEANKYKALFYLGFLTKEEWFSPAIEYLYYY